MIINGFPYGLVLDEIERCNKRIKELNKNIFLHPKKPYIKEPFKPDPAVIIVLSWVGFMLLCLLIYSII